LAALDPGAAPIGSLLPALFGFAFCAAVDHGLEPLCVHCAQQAGSLSPTPLLILTMALGLHALTDGALIAAGGPVAWGVLLHRLPESFAAGILLRSTAPLRRHAVQAVLALQGFALAGYAWAGHALSASRSAEAFGGLPAIGAGCLAYLALHGLHEQARHSPRTLWLCLAAGLLTRMASALP
jgi:zinc transporter ZupT